MKIKMNHGFFPADALVPEEKRTERLFLRPLKAKDNALDYDAVMSSADQLHRWSQTHWPTKNFTLAQNLEDLEQHEHEHLERKAFTFTVLNPAETRSLGCVYIMPLEPHTAELYTDAIYAANVGFWVRTSEVAHNLDKHLLATLREWFAMEWPHDCVVFIISQQENRQAAIMEEAGLERRSTIELSDGRRCWVFS